MNNTLKYIIGILILDMVLLFMSCSKKNSTGPAESTGGDFKTGAASTYTVSGTSSASVKDSISGATFELPAGSGAILTVSPVLTCPTPPFTAKVFQVDFTGGKEVKIKVPQTSGSTSVLMRFDALSGAAIDDMTGNIGWWGVDQVKEENGFLVYTVTLKAAGAGKAVAYTAPPADEFAISSIPNGSTDDAALRAIRQTVQQCIDQWVTNLGDDARTRVARLPYTISWSSDGNAYTGRNSTVFSNAVFYFKRNAQLVSIAHEVGHYMCHALLGYQRYIEIYSRFPADFWGSQIAHDMADYRPGRLEIFEDYPYVSMYMMIGNLDVYDPTSVARFNNVRDLMGKADPSSVDYPSHEAFGAIMLTSLLRTNNMIYSFSAVKGWDTANVPVVGASMSDVLRILSRGPRDVNELREYIQDYLNSRGTDDASKFSAMMEPMGWSYNGSGTVVDKSNKPVKGAHVQSISKVGTKEYKTFMSTPTGDDGTFLLPRIYPGSNCLRIFWNGDKDSTDVSYTADWINPTNVRLKMGTFTIAPQPITLTLTKSAVNGIAPDYKNPVVEITTTSTLTVTGIGIEVNSSGTILVPLNTPVSAQMTAVFKYVVLNGNAPQGKVYDMDAPVFTPGGKTSPYGALTVPSNFNFTDKSTNTLSAFDFTFIDYGGGGGFTISSYGFYNFKQGSIQSDGTVTWKTSKYGLSTPEFTFAPKK